MKRTVRTETEMMELGAEAAAGLESGDILALTGQLGSGKTHFAKGVVRGLGGDAGIVTSPTFTLVHEYPGARLPVFHFDFYRLNGPEEALAIGWDEYLDGGGVALVEWADKFPGLFPEWTRWWRFSILEDGGREVNFDELAS